MPKILNQEKVFFYTTGENLTTVIRDMWNSNLVNQALQICTDGGLSSENGVSLCTGKLKLIGDTRDGDHTLGVEADNIETYFTLEKQIEQLEELFVYHTDHASFLKRQLELSKLPTGRASVYRKSGNYSQYEEDEALREKVLQKSKQALAGLVILYSIAGKSLTDIPIDKLGTKLSSIEEDEVHHAWQIVHENVARRHKEDEILDNVSDETRETPWRVEPDSDLCSFRHGWISPDGYFYGCGYAEHNYLAQDIAAANLIPKSDDPSKTMDSLGWMKLQDSKFILVDFKKNIIPTQVQIDIIIDYSEKNQDGIIYYNFNEYENTSKFLEYLEEEKGYI